MTLNNTRVDNKNFLQWVILTGTLPLLDIPINFNKAINTLLLTGFDVPVVNASDLLIVLFSFAKLGLVPTSLGTPAIPFNGNYIPLQTVNFAAAAGRSRQANAQDASQSRIDFKHPITDGFISAWVIDGGTGVLETGGTGNIIILGSPDLIAQNPICET